MASASFVNSFQHVFLFVNALVALSIVTLSDGCTYPPDCGYQQSCCGFLCVVGPSCVGQSCSFHSDCQSWRGFEESCCNGVCKNSSNCWGSPCSFDSDCGQHDKCCHETCQRKWDPCKESKDNGLVSVIVGPIIGSLVFICCIIGCFFFICCRHASRTTVTRGPATTGATFTTASVTQGHPPHPGQMPPPHQQGYPPYPGQMQPPPPGQQQGYPYYPPVQYQPPQEMTEIPPPAYNPATMPPPATLPPPPPYPADPVGGSGG